MYACAIIGLAMNLTAVGVFYHVDASDTTWNLQSWSCQWKDVAMSTAPHWNTLCNESRAALYMTILLIPCHFLALAAIAWGAKTREELRASVIQEETNAWTKLGEEKSAAPITL